MQSNKSEKIIQEKSCERYFNIKNVICFLRNFIGLRYHLMVLFMVGPGFGVFSCTHSGYHFKRYDFYRRHSEGRSFLGQILPDLPFFPINGSRFRLSELKNIKAIVIVMREKNCPISGKYGHQITHIEKEYTPKGVQFIYNYVGTTRSDQNAQEDLERFKFKGPYVIDSRQKIIDALGATTTGEVFILTPERKLIYKGPLDDRFHFPVRTKSKEKNHYVTDILKTLILDKKIIPQELEAPGNLILRPMVKSKVYFKDVAPVIRKKCTNCHNPEGTGLMDFISYKDIVGRGAMFKYVIERDLMPPWYVDPNTGPFQDDISLTLKEKALLLQWIKQGFQKKKGGNEILWSKRKKLKSSKDKPDYVISLPEKVTVPAEGASFYKRFVIQTSFKEAKWIKSVQYILKPKIVHHFDIYIMNPSYKYNTKRNENRVGDFDYYEEFINLITTVPPSFNSSIKYDINKQHKDAGMRLPHKAKLVVEAHYESIGRKLVDDESRVLIYFHKKTPKYEILNRVSYAEDINIPPYESNYKVEDSHKVHNTMTLVDIATHTHLRGKASAIFLMNPKGVKKRIFGIDPFTKTFERIYTFKKPLIIEKGSTLKCINWFDNSAKNPMNPAPEKYVVQGLFIEQEMSLCFFRFLVPVDHSTSHKL